MKSCFGVPVYLMFHILTTSPWIGFCRWLCFPSWWFPTGHLWQCWLSKDSHWVKWTLNSCLNISECFAFLRQFMMAILTQLHNMYCICNSDFFQHSDSVWKFKMLEVAVSILLPLLFNSPSCFGLLNPGLSWSLCQQHCLLTWYQRPLKPQFPQQLSVGLV